MGTILWDFDGTLASRPGLWCRAMVDVLDRHDPGHGLSRDDFRPPLRDGFPWQHPEDPHPHLNDPDCRWAHVNRLIHTAYEHAGVTGSKARQHTAGFRDVFLEPATWTVYDDTVPALITLSAAGWRHMIVSNHVPELPRLVEDLGLSAHFDAVISSALVGHDKPHPEIFRIAIRDRDRPVVMVGDNPIADIEGAHAVGVPGFLVRREHDTLDGYPDLASVTSRLLEAAATGT